MKVDYSNLLTKLAGVVGVASVSLLMMPVGAEEALNPSPSIFTEATYSRSDRVLVNTQYTPSQPQPEAKQGKGAAQNEVAQTGERPKIFQECPYNRAACPSSGSGTPAPSTNPGVTPTPPQTPGAETAPSETPTAPAPGASTDGKNVVALAESNGSFKVLTRALKAAGLTEKLQGSGPFTIFAPTDAAFNKLPQDALQELLKPANKEVLLKILNYHVVSGQVLSTDLKSGEVKSVEGGAINVKVDGQKGVMVNDAKVVQPDLKASNGVVHAIDDLLLPPDL